MWGSVWLEGMWSTWSMPSDFLMNPGAVCHQRTSYEFYHFKYYIKKQPFSILVLCWKCIDWRWVISERGKDFFFHFSGFLSVEVSRLLLLIHIFWFSFTMIITLMVYMFLNSKTTVVLLVSLLQSRWKDFLIFPTFRNTRSWQTTDMNYERKSFLTKSDKE